MRTTLSCQHLAKIQAHHPNELEEREVIGRANKEDMQVIETDLRRGGNSGEGTSRGEDGRQGGQEGGGGRWKRSDGRGGNSGEHVGGGQQKIWCEEVARRKWACDQADDAVKGRLVKKRSEILVSRWKGKSGGWVC